MIHRLVPTLSLWFLALLSFLNHGVLASGFLNGAMDCPGVFLPGDEGDETKYISAKDDLKPLDGIYNCSYTAYCDFSDKGDVEELWIDPATKILTEYHCDFGIVGGCSGYVVNPNYAFWDEGGKHFTDASACPVINGCDRTKDNCQDGTAACGGGEYICKPSNEIINIVAMDPAAIGVLGWSSAAPRKLSLALKDQHAATTCLVPAIAL
mmetsp:Transcript_16307/g.30761  ORF Transcript_16307/g.30761 Transcript_16307/m.30761 type:complete len:209 (-) Transcript_16307:708-1334(-)